MSLILKTKSTGRTNCKTKWGLKNFFKIFKKGQIFSFKNSKLLMFCFFCFTPVLHRWTSILLSRWHMKSDIFPSKRTVNPSGFASKGKQRNFSNLFVACLLILWSMIHSRGSKTLKSSLVYHPIT